MNTLNQVSQLNTSVFRSLYLEDESSLREGKKMDLSQQSELKKVEVNVDIVYNLLKGPLFQYFQPKDRKLLLSLIQKNKTTSIAALVRINKKTICQDRKHILNPFIRPTRLLRMLEVVLTTKEKVYFPLLRTQVVDLSAKLSLLTKTECVDMDSSSSSPSMMSSSLFCKKVNYLPTKNSAKTCSTSFMYSPVELMVKEDIQERVKVKKNNKIKRVIKIQKSRCKFICKKKINGISYGKECGTVLINDETVCPKHADKKDNTSIELWSYTCKFVICQSQGKDRRRSKKGLECGEICNEGKDKCKAHEKSIIQVIEPTDCMLLKFIDDKGVEEYGETVIYPPYKQKKTVVRCFHVRAKLSIEQMKVYNKIAGDCRKTYNLLVDRQKEFKLDDISVEGLRSGLVNNLPEELDYLKQTPKDCRDFAVKEFVTSYKNCNDQYTKNTESREKYEQWCKENKLNPKPWKDITKPEIKFRLKREDQSINIEKRAIKINEKSITIYPTYFKTPIFLTRRAYRKKKNGTFRDKKWGQLLSKGLFHDIKLIRKKSGRFYFAIPYDKEIRNIKKSGFCSADPGVKTFLTTYDNNNKCISFGDGVDNKMYGLHAKLDKLKRVRTISKRSGNNCYHSLDKIIAKQQEHINDSIKDLHYKTIKEIKNYKLFYLPKFNSTQMSRGNELRGFTKRIMLSLAHYKFYLRLKTKAEETRAKVYQSDEFRTTMICTKCIRPNYTIEGSRWFKCNHCSFEWGRDSNASRNNLLKYCLC